MANKNTRYLVTFNGERYQFLLEDIVRLRLNNDLEILIPTREKGRYYQYSYEEFSELPEIEEEVKELLQKEILTPTKIIIDGKIVSVPVEKQMLGGELAANFEENEEGDQQTPQRKTPVLPKRIITVKTGEEIEHKREPVEERETKMAIQMNFTDMGTLLPVFSGKNADYIGFKCACEQVIELSENEAMVVKIIKIKLGNIVDNMPKDANTWDQIKKFLDEKYLPKFSKDWWETQLGNFKQNPGESLISYKERAEKLKKQLTESDANKAVIIYMTERITSKFSNGLRKELRAMVFWLL